MIKLAWVDPTRELVPVMLVTNCRVHLSGLLGPWPQQRW